MDAEKYHLSKFEDRHIGPRVWETDKMLADLGQASLDSFVSKVIPKEIRSDRNVDLGGVLSESELYKELKSIATKNKVFKSYLGLGYANCIVPALIKRNILENPGWYTQYTPYQAEISQGRLESLLNYQTMITDLTGLPVSNASLLDEATAAAEALYLSYSESDSKGQKKAYFVSKFCHPQTIDVLRGRCENLGIPLIIGDHRNFSQQDGIFGALLQYPASDGVVYDYTRFIADLKKSGALVALACDLLSLVLLKSPGELGADIALGSAQRFGVPLGFGGPHAAFFATQEAYLRKMPGRIVGVSKDRSGKRALRLTLQTREQHIKRERATSNICTAQALLANMSAMYAVYHGPEGLKAIANQVHSYAKMLKIGAKTCGLSVSEDVFFDTVKICLNANKAQELIEAGWKVGINLRKLDEQTIVVTLDETTSIEDVGDILKVISGRKTLPFSLVDLKNKPSEKILAGDFLRKTTFLNQKIFNSFHSETEFMRYLKRLENKDISLMHSMIPLGSCTMKLNAVSELQAISWSEFADIHPFAPAFQSEGYKELLDSLANLLVKITGFSAVSLQPNSGAQGEYTGLLVVKAYQKSKGEGHRNVCLIPSSAHGTNPASAALVGFEIVIVDCDKSGNVDYHDLEMKAHKYQDRLSVFMMTYPSTHGVFEADIQKYCDLIHKCGAQVYLDGANLNAQVGLCYPGLYGADVCHMNLHKTFCIPHGGGGPGAGPIAVKEHLADFLPGHCLVEDVGGASGIHAVSAAPYGNASILCIPWAYIRMMGIDGLKRATKMAILNANYIAHRLSDAYDVLYRGANGFVAHECIVDMRKFKKSASIEVIDIAKRLMDYGFHAPTVSFPVGGTLMIEPTESESLQEIDRFCDAMLAIREEIRQIEEGRLDRLSNPLKNAPHTMEMVVSSAWDWQYSREEAAMPKDWLRENKFWPSVGRIDEAYGDRNFMCTCS